MKKQNQYDLLLANMALLEVNQKLELEILKQQFHATYQSLQPINLIKDFFADSRASNTIATGTFSEKIISVVSGYLSNKMVLGASKNLVRTGIGSALQLLVAKSIANNTDVINKGITWVIQRFILKKNIV